ncbi:caltractin-like [Diaphorina citri]|uniref:Caltractin-like n=1 Tax=Diaphorina citri TaxID=121845 RepID=A0A3Q0JIK3_DIACI|nr:caltractin-like [Diaphorina citri]
MKALGFEADKEEIRSLMWGGVTGTGDSASRDRSAGITFQEFQNIMGVKMNQVDSDVDLERAFDLFDDDETGTITLRNLRRVARQLGEDEGEEELQAMIDAADRRGVGEVSLEDFKHVMRKATWAK